MCPTHMRMAVKVVFISYLNVKEMQAFIKQTSPARPLQCDVNATAICQIGQNHVLFGLSLGIEWNFTKNKIQHNNLLLIRFDSDSQKNLI